MLSSTLNLHAHVHMCTYTERREGKGGREGGGREERKEYDLENSKNDKMIDQFKMPISFQSWKHTVFILSISRVSFFIHL